MLNMPQEYCFGPFRLDVSRNGLAKDGAALAIGTRALKLLILLLQRNGGVVNKAELIRAAWPGTLVEEGNLTVQIAALRQLLGDTSRPFRLIVTVPGRGYRFAGRFEGGGTAQETPAGDDVMRRIYRNALFDYEAAELSHEKRLKLKQQLVERIMAVAAPELNGRERAARRRGMETLWSELQRKFKETRRAANRCDPAACAIGAVRECRCGIESDELRNSLEPLVRAFIDTECPR